jgi:DNA-binding MarR family transcriptional regulator
VTTRLDRDDLGFLLAKAAQRWNDALARGFAEAEYADVMPSFGSVLLPLYEEDGLQIGELGRRSGLSKQTMTALIRRVERVGLIERRGDPDDGRATLIFLTARAREFAPVARAVLRDIDTIVRAQLTANQLADLKESLRRLL